MSIYTVVRGDCLSEIAEAHGIRSWKELYNHPSNVAFRRRRPDPDLIYPGDRIYVPESDVRYIPPLDVKYIPPIKKIKATHVVRLHFRSLTLTAASFETHLKSAQIVFGQYGIKIEYGSGMSLRLSAEQARKYAIINGKCAWKINSGEYAEVQKLGGSVPSAGIRVYFVTKFATPGETGCGGHAARKPACIVAQRADKWTTAHEVCHVLLTSKFTPVHTTDIKNLMYSNTNRITGTPILTPAQVTQMKKSPYCVSLG